MSGAVAFVIIFVILEAVIPLAEALKTRMRGR